jgi:hypothetical protein
LKNQEQNPHNSIKFYILNDYKQINPLEITKEPNLSLLSYDIETTSYNINKFPDPSLYTDKIV